MTCTGCPQYSWSSGGTQTSCSLCSSCTIYIYICTNTNDALCATPPPPPSPPPPPTCFATSSTAQVYGRGTVLLTDLRTGDRVLDGITPGGSPFIADMHTNRHTAKLARFYAMTYAGDGVEGTLLISTDHYMYTVHYDAPSRVRRLAAVLAQDVKEGMLVLHVTPTNGTDTVLVDVVVKQIAVQWSRGVTAPLVESGRIAVGGIVASCFTEQYHGWGVKLPVDQRWVGLYPLALLARLHPALVAPVLPTDLHWYLYVVMAYRVPVMAVELVVTAARLVGAHVVEMWDLMSMLFVWS